MWILVLIGAGLLSALVHLLIIGFGGGVSVICEVIVLHQFAVTHGLLGVLGFYINVIKADSTAKSLGWPGGPFQVKYGFSQLGVGVMGILSIWLRGPFWIGTLVTLYMYGISGLWTHTAEVIKSEVKSKTEIANIILDVIYHVVITILLLQVPGVWG
ncbi:hypothetical protein DFR58_10420 [Anaerobacterium chartisolvens]|uniref:Uncharacterized protein n=1 Tax=Anaerobacterium chartisolvens TaxID=1297424 RepID=A0A369BBF9_9FIRM|nr:DUF6790 family protein [Anaerobacterium chartisolvens]RCX18751.1 hypothetical protein DFR58_10420 [Anaerobacterium chartisolvens]